MSSPIKGKWIVVTRPAHQSEDLVKKLKDGGANVICFPLLEIKPVRNSALIKKQLEKLDQYQLVIFVSANAVEHCFTLIPSNELSSLKVAVVGKKTAQKFKNYGLNICCTPQSPFNSEALLVLPELKKLGANDKVVIIRGEGGREFLKESLQAQGVQVDYIDVYRRSCPQQNLDVLSKLFRRQQLDIILLTSVGSADNLFNLHSNDDDSWLNHAELMVGSSRIKQQITSSKAHKGEIYSAKDPSDETLYNQLMIWGAEGKENNAD